MAGLIDVGIIKPELAGAFGAGYESSRMARQQAAQAEQQLTRGRQQMQMDEMRMRQLQEDRTMMLELQQRLKAAGQDPDLDKVFDALIATGNPDYVTKGLEGKQRLQDQREFARITGGFGGAAPGAPAAAAPGAAAPMVPSAAPAAAAPAPAPTALFNEAALSSLSPMTQDNIRAQYDMSKDLRSKGQIRQAEFLEDRAALMMANDLLKSQGWGFPVATQEQIAAAREALRVPAPAAAPVNTLAPAAPAATNAMILGVAAPAGAAVPTAAAPAGAAAPVTGGVNPALIAQTQDRINQLLSFAGRARNPQMATNALAQAKVLQDQLELYSRPERAGPAKPASLQELEAYMAMTPEQKAAFERLQKIKQPNVTATASATSPTGKSLAAPVGARAETSLVKAEGAAGIMESANMVREALNSGNVIAGTLAGPRLKFAQLMETVGAGDKQKLINTRSAIQGLATLTLESRAELKGQGQVTENEQKLLEKARSASVEDMTVAELQQVVNVSQRLANRLWSNHQNLLKTMETDPAAADSIRYYRPAVTLPQAVGEGKPQTPAETDKRKQGLDSIFNPPPQRR
jgi:hypothetical protein